MGVGFDQQLVGVGRDTFVNTSEWEVAIILAAHPE
jgi:hypothetical protein